MNEISRLTKTQRRNSLRVPENCIEMFSSVCLMCGGFRIRKHGERTYSYCNGLLDPPGTLTKGSDGKIDPAEYNADLAAAALVKELVHKWPKPGCKI